MGICELGHTGLWVYDLALMRDFYTRVLGLTVTDEDPDEGMVFLSSRPDEEHHEMVLAAGRTAPLDTRQTHQISWRLDSLDSLIDYRRRFAVEGVPIQQVVTHGNAFGIYFFDPERNRNEVYWPTGEAVRQPFRKSLELDQEPEAILAEAAALLHAAGPRYQPVRDEPPLP
ncbi:MAG TPA: VOC family protein [Acidimicrobiales bacterium]|nr:VOC family protein [Acidimicrobiales bacterium]